MLVVKSRKSNPLGLIWGVEVAAAEGKKRKKLLDEKVLFQAALQSKPHPACS